MRALLCPFVIACVLGGCSEQRTRTQVMLRVDAEEEVRIRSPWLRVFIYGGDSAEVLVPSTLIREDSFAVDRDEDWPRTIALAPEGGNAKRVFRVVAQAVETAEADAAIVAEARVIGGYLPGKTLLVEVLLEGDCLGVECSDETETCADGTCATAFIDPATLPTYSRPDASPVDAGEDDAVCDEDTCQPDPCGEAICRGAICLRTSLCGETQICCGGECAAAGCDDADECTDDACGARGCVHRTRDADGDGFGTEACPFAGGTPNTDCDDMLDTVSPGATEVCDGEDNDCDDALDEGFECTLGATGSCCGSGSRTCGEGCVWDGCMAPSEVCNGADDDCDGELDETFTCVKDSTQACCGSGAQLCGASCVWETCDAPDEVCNGADDDCDGELDETFACVKDSTQICCGGDTQTCDVTCEWEACVPPEEVCNDLDDDCDSAIDEFVTDLAVAGSTSGGTFSASLRPHDQEGSCGGTGAEATFRLTLDEAQDVFLTTHGSNLDTVLYVRSSLCAGTEVGCALDSDGFSTSTLQLTNLAAGVYYVFVDTSSAISANVTLHVYLTTPAAAGDRCGNPEPLAAGRTSALGTTCGFTNDYDASVACTPGCESAGDSAACYDAAGGTEERVYYFYLPAAGMVDFSTCGAVTVADTLLSIRTDCQTELAGSQVACNDDNCGGTPFDFDCNEFGLRSRIQTSLSAGLYFLVVDGWTNCGCGSYGLTITGL